MKVATLLCLAYSHFHLFLCLQEHLAGQEFHKDEEVTNEIATQLCAQAVELYDI